jgi:hypothetical protein
MGGGVADIEHPVDLPRHQWQRLEVDIIAAGREGRTPGCLPGHSLPKPYAYYLLL